MAFKLIYLARRNPAVTIEDWPRTWRSHAVFASQFAVLGASIDSLFYCSRLREPTVDGAPFEPPGAARDYDGAAIISSPSADALDGDMDPADRARLDDDELRVFGAYSRDFSLRCEETLVRGGAPGAAALIRFLARKPGSSPEAFHAHWNGAHAAIALRAADAGRGVTRYVHNALIEAPPPGYPFDGVAETWFASAEDAARASADAASDRVDEDLPAFCDLDRSVTLLTSVTHRWPRG